MSPPTCRPSTSGSTSGRWKCVQTIEIDDAYVPESWAAAVEQAHGHLRPGTTAVTITGTRHRSGVWNGETRRVVVPGLVHRLRRLPARPSTAATSCGSRSSTTHSGDAAMGMKVLAVGAAAAVLARTRRRRARRRNPDQPGRRGLGQLHVGRPGDREPRRHAARCPTSLSAMNANGETVTLNQAATHPRRDDHRRRQEREHPGPRPARSRS